MQRLCLCDAFGRRVAAVVSEPRVSVSFSSNAGVETGQVFATVVWLVAGTWFDALRDALLRK